jgi:hypothetical protein
LSYQGRYELVLFIHTILSHTLRCKSTLRLDHFGLTSIFCITILNINEKMECGE